MPLLATARVGASLGVFALAIVLCPVARAIERLELTACAPAQPGAVRVRLHNAGSVPLRVIRPHPDWLAQLGDWGGWTLRIAGTEGDWMPYPFPGGVPPVSAIDQKDLAAGADLRFELELGAWMPTADLPLMIERTVRRLSEVPGHYRLEIRYRPGQDAANSGAGTPTDTLAVVDLRVPAVAGACPP